MNAAAVLVVLALGAAAAPAQAADPCAGLSGTALAKCRAKNPDSGGDDDAPTKRRVGDDDDDEDSGDGGGGDDVRDGLGGVDDGTQCAGCMDVPLALYDCELCTPACKLGSVVGGVSGGILGFVGGVGVGWFLLSAESDPLEQRLSETATAGLIGAIGVGAAGVVVGAGVGTLFGLFDAVDETKPPPKKRAPSKRRRR